MTNTELIQAIKTEIERHLNSATEHQNANPDMPKYRWYLYEGEKELCTDLLGYIDDSLESENPVPTDLEEAAEEYSKKVSDGHNYRDLRVGFIAGYKYHADHTPLPEDTVLFNKGVAEGKRLMMEEAVAIIQSRLSEIIGDAQPKPALRAELEELIKRIKE